MRVHPVVQPSSQWLHRPNEKNSGDLKCLKLICLQPNETTFQTGEAGALYGRRTCSCVCLNHTLTSSIPICLMVSTWTFAVHSTLLKAAKQCQDLKLYLYASAHETSANPLWSSDCLSPVSYIVQSSKWSARNHKWECELRLSILLQGRADML